MKNNILEIKNLSIQYHTDLETVYAVNNISFSLADGETLGLVGETGAGKTTSALGIMGLLPKRTARVTGGEVLFEGRDLLKLSEKEMLAIRGVKISMIFQDPMTALNPVLTVGSQIAEAIELHNTQNLSKTEIDALVDETLEMVGIPAERKKEYPYQFSGGMRQRVVIAMALICNPKLLIADEPTTALDVTIQAQILSMICDLQRKLGTSVILITHDLGVVAETCDKVAIMYAGEVVEYGRLEDIFAGPLHHPYTEGLFGSIPNLKENTRRLHPIEGLMPDPTDLPKGCRFAPRCKYCREICQNAAPPVFVDEKGSGIASQTEATHLIRCHFAEKAEKQER
ncbi:MAG: ABC transporter ATP-binding protein [Oscillospiraceae bacterium]|nr:ABC transporter ATP-binding protein [Oscillospiraceae bacterium]